MNCPDVFLPVRWEFYILVIYLEDTVTNGNETVRFSKLMTDRAGYRFREDLGTLPSVYYLPPTERSFPVESGLEGYDESITGRYKNAGPR